jgi:Zn-dependent M28 family amino/carboxypeptidase
MMEALRILRAARVPLRRTVRVALWTGEEQGLLGSRAYVRRHLVDPRTGAPTPEHDRHSIYLNLDLGTGKIRGVYLQGNEGARPLFGAWITPFEDRGMRTLTSASVTGTDHLSFDAVGIPAFQFIQDPVEYATRSHHSSADLYERVQADDVRWNAVVVAVLAMQAANRAERFPRKPPAEPAGGGPSPRRR